MTDIEKKYPKLHPVKFGSHLPLLMTVMGLSTGRVLEMGMGYSSSLYLHWECARTGRKLVSYENDAEWFERFGVEFSKHGYYFHHVYPVKTWDEAGLERHHWGVAFLDHNPAARRKEDIKRLAAKGNADFIVIHDTEARVEKHFHYSEIYPLFKYVYQCQTFAPYTSVLSNVYDVTTLKV